MVFCRASPGIVETATKVIDLRVDHSLIQDATATMVHCEFASRGQNRIRSVPLMVGDNISTGIIMPARNRVLPLRKKIPAISDFVFDIVDERFMRSAPGKRAEGSSARVRKSGGLREDQTGGCDPAARNQRNSAFG